MKVKIVNNGKSYTTHIEAKSKFGCKNYAHNEYIPNGVIAKVIRVNTDHKDWSNGNKGSYSVEYNGKHYLIGTDGVEVVNEKKKNTWLPKFLSTYLNK